METKTGKFAISSDKQVWGELRIAGRESTLTLRSDDPVYFGGQRGPCIKGELYDLQKVTLIDCVQIGGESYSTHALGVKSHSATLFPHFVVQGKAHLEHDKPTIIDMSFTFEDAFPLFYDHDAFGYVIDPTQHIETMADANGRYINRKIHTGPTPEIGYFTGRSRIVEADTALGRLVADHNPARPFFGGPRGIRIDNQISVTITPRSPIVFDDAIDRVLSVARFITLATGRKQSVPRLSINVGTPEGAQRLQVDWSHHPRPPEEAMGSGPPQSADLPLDPIHFPEEFVSVLKFWFSVDGERSVARARIQDCFAQQSYYSADRLVAAANAYDQLPQAAVPQDVKLSDEVRDAKKQCKAIFRPLSKSYERESLLQALGRIGKANLKQKVRHRANIIVTEAGSKFPALYEVCDHAIDCRNYFVHGDDRMKFDVDDPPGHLGFLTATLEFVFGASELIEGGWDIKRFLATPTSMSHPYGAYRVDYANHLKALQDSCGRRKTSDVDVENE
jgi:hypothetical protein